MRRKNTPTGKTQREVVESIAKKLQTYQKRKYKTKKSAKTEAKIIFGKLTENKQKPTLKNIWQYSRKHRKKKLKEAPKLPDFLTQPNPYFSLLEYDYWIKRCTNDVFFESTLSPSTLPLIQGGTKIDAEEFFLDFIRYCNILKSQTDPNESRYTDEWQILCTQPQLINGVWISTIICVNEEGEQTNYGFDPERPSAEPREPMPPRSTALTDEDKPPTPPAPQTPTPEPAQGQSEGDRAKEIRLTIESYTQLYRDKLLTKKEYLELVSELNKKFAKGGNL